MKKLLIMVALLPVLAFAQNSEFRTYSLNDGTVYVKNKSNLVGGNAWEAGVSSPLFTRGNLGASWNSGIVLNSDNPWNSSTWTAGVTFGYRLNRTYTAYTKTSTNLSGDWSQETGVRTVLFRSADYSVSANAGYIFNYPWKDKSKPRWTVGVTASFPLRSFK